MPARPAMVLIISSSDALVAPSDTITLIVNCVGANGGGDGGELGGGKGDNGMHTPHVTGHNFWIISACVGWPHNCCTPSQLCLTNSSLHGGGAGGLDGGSRGDGGGGDGDGGRSGGGGEGGGIGDSDGGGEGDGGGGEGDTQPLQ